MNCSICDSSIITDIFVCGGCKSYMCRDCIKSIVESSYNPKCLKCNNILDIKQLQSYFKDDIHITIRLLAIVSFQNEKQKIPELLQDINLIKFKRNISKYTGNKFWAFCQKNRSKLNELYKLTFTECTVSNLIRCGIEVPKIEGEFKKDIILKTNYVISDINIEYPYIFKKLNRYIIQSVYIHHIKKNIYQLYKKYIDYCKIINAIILKIKEKDDELTLKFGSELIDNTDMVDSLDKYVIILNGKITAKPLISKISIKQPQTQTHKQYVSYCSNDGCKGLCDSTGKCDLCNSISAFDTHDTTKCPYCNNIIFYSDDSEIIHCYNCYYSNIHKYDYYIDEKFDNKWLELNNMTYNHTVRNNNYFNKDKFVMLLKSIISEIEKKKIRSSRHKYKYYIADYLIGNFEEDECFNKILQSEYNYKKYNMINSILKSYIYTINIYLDEMYKKYIKNELHTPHYETDIINFTKYMNTELDVVNKTFGGKCYKFNEDLYDSIHVLTY